MWWTLRNFDRGTPVIGVPEKLPDIDPDHRAREVMLGSGLSLLGIGGLAAGGHFIVSSALKLAVSIGISETLIGLTLVAVGTSLPELATTVVAAVRNEDDLALGNIVGSNLFNILAVAGPVGLVRELEAESGPAINVGIALQLTPLQMQMISMLFVTALVFTMIILGKGRIGRGRGLALLAIYGLIMGTWATLK